MNDRPPEADWALESDALGYRYRRGAWALRDCALRIPRGAITALVGPNGAGKTTLLHLFAALARPTEGSVRITGANPELRLERLGFVPQDAPLWSGFRVADALEAGRRMNPRWDAGLAAARIADLAIPPRARIGTLSGGQRAQVALTLVLAKRPDVLLLDEPLANLDPLARRAFLGSVFDACADTGATVVFSSHVIAELERICDHLVVLSGGRVRLAGDIDDLRAEHRIVSGPAGRPDLPGTVSRTDTAGRRTALVRGTTGLRPGPGLDDAEPTFDELVMGYLTASRPGSGHPAHPDDGTPCDDTAEVSA
ncbi:ABC transporter ATP-binding protein [Uniformispora flossi]|uniref:ABC transporter ATP-binding protein n=1 Tax=Uniformispora flossi TaxID=3390723 RepID=UPI003C2DB387